MEKETEKKQYEISFVLKDEAAAKAVEKFIKDLGGEIELESSVGKIALAYPIQKETYGYFGFLHFSIMPEEIKHLEHEMTTKAEVLRHLIITPPFKKQAVKPKIEGQEKTARAAQVRTQETKTEALTNEDLEKKIEEILG